MDGTTLVLTYDEPLDETSAPDESRYTVNVDGGVGPAPVAVSISGSEVTLTLAAAVTVGGVVTLSYDVPETMPVQDVAGNAAAGLTDAAVDNETTDTEAPAFASAAVDGTELVITFTEDLAAAANLANGAFTVNKTPFGGSAEPVALSGTPVISGAAVTLTLAGAVAYGDVVTVSYEKPATDNSDRLEDDAGNEVADFIDRVATNNTVDTDADTRRSSRPRWTARRWSSPLPSPWPRPRTWSTTRSR